MIAEELAGMIVGAGIDNYPPDGGLIHAEFKEADQAELTILTETGGLGGEQVLNEPGIKYQQPTLQIQTRSVDSVIGRHRLQDIYNLFNGVRNQYIAGVWYRSVDPLQPPFFIQRDENDRWFYGFNLVAVKRVS